MGKLVRRRVESLDCPSTVEDVDPFREDARDRRLPDRDLLLSELGRVQP